MTASSTPSIATSTGFAPRSRKTRGDPRLLLTVWGVGYKFSAGPVQGT